uniref:Mitochondrial cardiolipin hydrolase n=1 Tax=Marmota marmota marmota TaxID=9994 RepID=A0A8C5Z7W3_MARMA
MERLRWQMVGVAAAGFALALEALPWLLRRLRAGRPRREVLFFPSQVTCTEALLQAPGAAPPAALGLPVQPAPLRELAEPPAARAAGRRASLELCLFAFSSPQLGRAVRCSLQRGCDGLSSTGIQVRHDQDLGYMHHKFAIVDKKVLITGSLNWTTQAIQNNRENVLIMEDAEYVKLFLEEFERIWEEFNPAKYSFFPQKKRSR